MSGRAVQFLCTLVWSSVLFTGAVRAQSDDDDRDVVTLKSGRAMKGRVLLQFGPDELVLMQNGSRRRIAKKQIQTVVTVNDYLRELLQRREKHAGDQKFTWTLAQWAESKGLHHTARLLALDIVLNDDSHQAAHKLLGHKLGRRGWRWKRGAVYRSRKAHEEYIADMGHPLKLRSEHFEVQTNAGLRKAFDTLMDLERLYLFFSDSFGSALQLQESLKPMTIQVWSSVEQFPASTGRKEAFIAGRNAGDYVATFYGDGADRPRRLFTVACQSILENTLTLQKNDPSHGIYSRVCAWADVGFSEWVASCMHGKPGHAVPGESILDRRRLGRVLAAKPKLKIMTHLRYKLFLNPGRRASEHWDSTWAFVYFLMDENKSPNKRASFMSYVRAAFYEGKGDSSSEFDKAMGEPLEKVEKRFYAWLRKNAK